MDIWRWISSLHAMEWVLLAMMFFGTIGPIILIIIVARRLRSMVQERRSWRWWLSVLALVLVIGNFVALAACFIWTQNTPNDAHYYDGMTVWARAAFAVALLGIAAGIAGCRGQRLLLVGTNVLLFLAWAAFGSVAV